MRKTISFVAVFALMFTLASCVGGARKKLKEAKENVSAAKNVVKGLSKMEKQAEQSKKDLAALQEVEPFTNEKFRNWMPDNLDGMTRTSFEFSSSMGNQGKMSFKSEEADDSNDNSQKKSLSITIIDGAGEMGALVFASQGFITGFIDDYYSESETKLERIVERKGNKALETYYKEKNSTEIKAVIESRYIVLADAKNMDVDDTWKLIDKLKIERLK